MKVLNRQKVLSLHGQAKQRFTLGAPIGKYDALVKTVEKCITLQQAMEAGQDVPWAERWNAFSEASKAADELAQWAWKQATALWEEAVACLPESER